jgi:hypothetical protein
MPLAVKRQEIVFAHNSRYPLVIYNHPARL